LDRNTRPLEGYRECHICTVEEKTLERRCHYCTGRLSLRDRLHLTIERRWRRKVSPYLSALMPGLGHWFRGRRYVGTFFFALTPLAAGLVLATYRGWNWGLSLLALGCGAVWIVALVDAVRGPTEYDPPCEDACPAGLPCSRYLHLLAEGKDRESLELILTRCPFPGTIGRVCHHPCEQACNRAKDGEAISICVLKRFADDHGAAGEENFYLREMTAFPASIDRRVAVVGSGPAGLSAALFLRLLGFSVSLFESRAEAGGTPRFYLASYRLPADVYKREVERVLQAGIDLRLGKELGKDFTLADLAREGFHGAFLGLGAMRSIRLPHTGREDEGFLDGRDFLEKALSPAGLRLHGSVLVIGGGNVAVDVARTALRCGAARVRMMCLETEKTMPAHRWEIDEAVREGVELYPAGATVSFASREQRVCMASCRRVERIDKEPNGRLKPVLATGEGFDLESDWVITAVGSSPDWSALGGKTRPPQVALHGKIPVAILDSHEAPAIPVVLGGDLVKGPASVIEAIAAGREGALHLYRVLAGSPPVSVLFRNRSDPPPFPNYEDSPEMRRRLAQIEIAPGRRTTFDEVYLGFDEKNGRAEADRCIRCDWPLISERKARKRGWVPR
jgi:NADPH-dependent glutamate synthase beta subunit-like oxidoreductase